ncbi:MAG: hypothetical protein JW793_09055 [Acidobacteria bacterium]|nr:hypothetical protein [Acidobacteriota bacterium]
MGAMDWDRRLFDGLIPLQDGTSYNANLIKGAQKTALVDTVDPAKKHILFERLQSLNVEIIPPVLSKGLPGAGDFAALDLLADAFRDRILKPKQ